MMALQRQLGGSAQYMHVDRRASVIAGAELPAQVPLSGTISAATGTVIVGRLLDDMPHELEIDNGRMVQAAAGDTVVGALGARRALRGVAGELPASVAVGDVLHVLNRGGVIGLAQSPGAARLVVLGAVQGPNGPLNIGDSALKALPVLPMLPPVVAVAGSCMHAGKTAAAVALVRSLSRAGYKVGVVKLTGVAAQRDVLAMTDAGAASCSTFVDAGLPSTCGDGDVVGAARACLASVAADGVEVIVAELGDGLLGDYGVDALLADEGIRNSISACVLSAVDPVAAWGGAQLLTARGIKTTVVTGATTDNVAGCEAVTRHIGAPAANARTAPETLAHHVMVALNKAATSPSVVKPSVSKPSTSPALASLAAAFLGAA